MRVSDPVWRMGLVDRGGAVAAEKTNREFVLARCAGFAGRQKQPDEVSRGKTVGHRLDWIGPTGRAWRAVSPVECGGEQDFPNLFKLSTRPEFTLELKAAPRRC